MSKQKIKKPRIANEPYIQKQPTIGNYSAPNDSGTVFWSFALIDCDGPWSFNKICRDEFHELVTNGFKHKEGVSWAEIKSSGSHHVEKNKIIKNAQKRLSEIYLDDHDELFSMRFTGKKRIWGIRDGNIFKLLWWDPNHEICPSHKKHT